MRNIAIIGAGTMGTDIAFAALTAGYTVRLHDINMERAHASVAHITDRLNRYRESGKIDPDTAAQASQSLHICRAMEESCEAEFIIESVYEDLSVKREVFRSLDRLCAPHAVLATSTSCISITEIASATSRPESVVGVHFMNPAHVMQLVEIIPGIATTRETVETAKSFVRSLGKTFVEAKDYPGFMLNRMLIPMINEAVYLLYEEAGTAEAIDKVMRLGLNLPMGPLALADMIGLDVVLAVAEEMHRGYSESKYRPCPLLKKYVAAGYLGEKTGRGFYIYND